MSRMVGTVACCFCNKTFPVAIQISQVICNSDGSMQVAYQNNSYSTIKMKHDCKPPAVDKEIEEMIRNG